MSKYRHLPANVARPLRLLVGSLLVFALFLYTNQPAMCALFKACHPVASCCGQCECSKKTQGVKSPGCCESKEIASATAQDSLPWSGPVACVLAHTPAWAQAANPAAPAAVAPTPSSDSEPSQAALRVFRI